MQAGCCIRELFKHASQFIQAGGHLIFRLESLQTLELYIGLIACWRFLNETCPISLIGVCAPSDKRPLACLKVCMLKLQIMVTVLWCPGQGIAWSALLLSTPSKHARSRVPRCGAEVYHRSLFTMLQLFYCKYVSIRWR